MGSSLRPLTDTDHPPHELIVTAVAAIMTMIRSRFIPLVALIWACASQQGRKWLPRRPFGKATIAVQSLKCRGGGNKAFAARPSRRRDHPNQRHPGHDRPSRGHPASHRRRHRRASRHRHRHRHACHRRQTYAIPDCTSLAPRMPPPSPPPCPPPPCQSVNCACWTTPESACGVGAAFANPARPMAEKPSVPAIAPAPTIFFRIMRSLSDGLWPEQLSGW